MPLPTCPRPFLRVLRACLLTLALAIGMPALADRPLSVQLPSEHHFQSAGFLLALERGHYRRAGLHVELRSGGAAALSPLDAVLGGQADFGIGGSGVALARVRQQPVVAVAALQQYSTEAWLLRPGLDPADLAGLAQRPALLPASVPETVELRLPFARQGLSLAAVAQPAADELQAWRRGQADLVAIDLSRQLPGLDRGAQAFRILHPHASGLPSYGNVLFTSDAFARDHADAVRRFRDASLRGWAEALEDVEGTAKLLHTRYLPQVPERDLIAAGRLLREAAGYGANELGHMSRQRWLAIAAAHRAAGFGQGELDVDDFLFDARLAEQPAWPDPVRIATVGLVLALLFALARVLRGNASLAREVLALKALERERQAGELRFQFLMDVAPFPVAIYRWSDGVVRYANERAGACLRERSIEGAPIHRWLPPLSPEQLDVDGLRAGRMLEDVEAELPPEPGDDRARWCQLSVRAIEYGGEACGFVTFADISARKRAEQETRLLSEQRGVMLEEVARLQARLREASVRDALTGLFNRRHFDAVAERERAHCRRGELSLGLLVVDADHFKRINDTHGHAGGDAVLRRLGQLMSAGFRAGDIACRFGGEEFAVLLPDIGGSALLDRAEALRAAVEAAEIEHEGQRLRVTVSIGAALLESRSEEAFESLFQRADAAAYAAKQAGRNRVVIAAAASVVG